MHSSRIGTAVLAAAALATASSSNLDAQTLKGSESSVWTMYSYATRHDFDFLKNKSQVLEATKSGKLVALSANSPDYVLHNITYPYVMPAAKLFVERLGAQYREACKEKMVVTSATRPETMKLRNASDLSVHPTGMAVDLRSTKIATKCRQFLESTLPALEKAGVIEATRETRPPHYHVAVFPESYKSYVASLMAVAENEAESSGPAGSTELQLTSYLVRAGDSLWKIAVKHDTTVQALQDFNKLRNATIHPGQVILVPAH